MSLPMTALSFKNDMTRAEWLAQIREDDMVAVYFDSTRMNVEQVTSAPRTFISVGKHAKRVNFRRDTGRMTGCKSMCSRFHIERP